jgi:hypothetical protein
MGRLAVAAATNPDAIAAAQKEHKRRQREARAFHKNRGNQLISGRRELIDQKIDSFQAYIVYMEKQLISLKDGLATGRLSTGDVRKRLRELHAERLDVPQQIDRACTDLKAVTDLDPIEASGDFSRRFPAMSSHMKNHVPLPARGGSDDDDST